MNEENEENHNGMIRKFLTKGTDFEAVTKRTIKTSTKLDELLS
ncbi:MAG: hypothetical protein WC162_02840 [Sphaerochaetaceae bacterium]